MADAAEEGAAAAAAVEPLVEYRIEDGVLKESDGGRARLLLELEFVQCLANPSYIHYLAQNRYFDDPAFVAYLKYLQYWRRPQYTAFIVYPHCLYFLELLQSSHFRSVMAHPHSKELAHRQQYFYWQHFRNNRLKALLAAVPPPADSGNLPGSVTMNTMQGAALVIEASTQGIALKAEVEDDVKRTENLKKRKHP
eukprot:SM000054S18117  [mRNA]  locus=s54:516775:518147:- [translate_table: standard]